MGKGDYRPQGREITVQDVAERLIPDLDINELLLWAPDLFALTSYIFSLTGAYQLVVSPPSQKKWQPDKAEIENWLGVNKDKKDKDSIENNLKNWLEKLITKWNVSEDFSDNTIKWKGLDLDNYFSSKFIEELNEESDKVKEIVKHITGHAKLSFQRIDDLCASSGKIFWITFVETLADEWRKRLNKITDEDFYLLNDGDFENEKIRLNPEEAKQCKKVEVDGKEVKYREKYSTKEERQEKLLEIVLKYTPPLLITCWAFFYLQSVDQDLYDERIIPEINEIYNRENKPTLRISDMLCNRDDIQQLPEDFREKIWNITQSLLAMHAIADITCTQWGIVSVPKKENERTVEENNAAQWFAERLLFRKGSLSTANTERCRIMPKRHNPDVGITLRSISANLGFHRSSVEVVWRKTHKNPLAERIKMIDEENKGKKNKDKKENTLSLLLIPFPLDIKAKDFRPATSNSVINLCEGYEFFAYEPAELKDKTQHDKEEYERNVAKKAKDLIEKAREELTDKRQIDIVVFPESSLNKEQYEYLEMELSQKNITPSILIAGVTETPDQIAKELNLNKKDGSEKIKIENINFPRNAVYCKYFNAEEQKKYFDKGIGKKNNNESTGYGNFINYDKTPKYKQYKHHRWRLENSQIKQYGLSHILDNSKIWWEFIKVSKRRVSFLNIGDKMTLSHLICEDLARQDPISDLIRHVGPSLVVTILMDGPQLKNRWSSRYATVLSDDPGSSVITLTSLGMLKRHSSAFGLMSRVIALWSEGGSSNPREIELAHGAEAVLLNLTIKEKNEKTADGREERVPTSNIILNDVIQIYPLTRGK